MNLVAGSPLRIALDDTSNEIEFGTATTTADGYGRFDFVKRSTASISSGADTANAVRVTGRRDGDSQSGTVALPFPSFGMDSLWNVTTQSVAMQVDRDIAIVVDRSGSMVEKTYDWPKGKSPWTTSLYDKAVKQGLLTKKGGSYYFYANGVTAYDYQDWVWQEVFDLGTPPASKWEALLVAVQSFLTVLEGTDQAELVSMSSYETTATLDLNLQSNALLHLGQYLILRLLFY